MAWRCTCRSIPSWRYHEVDGVRLRQIVFNLLSNAIKFTSQGEVRLQLDVLGPTSEDGVQPLCLSVTDTGMGIAPEQLQHLFAPFTQAGCLHPA